MVSPGLGSGNGVVLRKYAKYFLIHYKGIWRVVQTGKFGVEKEK
jgi:hypothetical protein